MRSLFVPVVLLTSFAVAQQEAKVKVTRIAPINILGKQCPIKFNARANGDAVMALAKNGKPFPDSQPVSLFFTADQGKAIASATVTIRGIKQTRPMLLTGTSGQQKVLRSFDVQRAASEASLSQTDVTVSGMTSLRIAELTEITYADGSVWRPSEMSGCRAQLGGIRLIDSPMQ